MNTERIDETTKRLTRISNDRDIALRQRREIQESLRILLELVDTINTQQYEIEELKKIAHSFEQLEELVESTPTLQELFKGMI